jgi:hypothetical protein
MNNRNLLIGTSLLIFGVFFNYLSLGNPGLLVIILGMIGLFVSTANLINYNRISYYVICLSIIIIQSIILINTYGYNMTYLQNSKEYIICASGIFAYFFVLLLIFKPNIFNEN